MGLAGVGADYLAAIRSDDQFDLVALADTDPQVLRRHSEGTPVRAYEDYRSLIVETAHSGLDLLFVTLEPFQSLEFVDMAAARGIGVFHKAPLARNVGEAQRLVRRFAESECPLVVSRPWQFEPAFSRLEPLTELAGHVYAVSAVAATADSPLGWRGDSVRAGGGVLLNGAYEPLDILVHLLGLPEMVYAQCGLAVPPGTPRNYDTEDAAIVSLRFRGGQIGSVTAVRGAAEASWHIILTGADRTVELRPDRIMVSPHRGGIAECHTVQTGIRVAPAVSAFGAARLCGAAMSASAARQHLPTMALIEAAYLSAKTGAPESPERFIV